MRIADMFSPFPVWLSAHLGYTAELSRHQSSRSTLSIPHWRTNRTEKREMTVQLRRCFRRVLLASRGVHRLLASPCLCRHPEALASVFIIICKFSFVYIYLECSCVRAPGCVCLCVYALRIVSTDKILCFMNILNISI